MNQGKEKKVEQSVYRVPPLQYIHVLDQNKNLRRVEIGPCIIAKKAHETVIKGPLDMIVLPPEHYCVIKNPVDHNEKNEIVMDAYGEYKLRHGRIEIRKSENYPTPFPLYPGEELQKEVTPYIIVKPKYALVIRAVNNFEDKKAGDCWLIKGPAVYVPKIDEELVKEVEGITLKHNEALRMKAVKTISSKEGKTIRKGGEEWLVRGPGNYLCDVDEEIVKKIEGIIISDRKAVHIQALTDYIDCYNVKRRAGEEWLITKKEAEFHIPDVNENIINEIQLTVLSKSQYCVIVNPLAEDGKHLYGTKEVRRGELSFFLQPGEKLDGGIKNIYILDQHKALLLEAKKDFVDDQKVKRAAGTRWLVRGPREYIPPTSVNIIEERNAIALHINEGVYVRNMRTGDIRIVQNQVHMLTEEEQLWEKELLPEMELLLQKSTSLEVSLSLNKASDYYEDVNLKKRDKTKAVVVPVPHCSAMQIFDYKNKKERIVFGPDMVMLEPYEEITLLRMSGGIPKKEDQQLNLALLLGPSLMRDLIIVETSDHARLYLRISYDWTFNVDKKNPETYKNLFAVPDFIGEACKILASRIRGAVAAVPFDHFHKNSTSIIRSSIFKFDKDNLTHGPFIIKSSGLIISSVDIQGLEPVDDNTRKSLEESIKLSIDITAKTQEAYARHEAERLEQDAQGEREKQAIVDNTEAEKKRIDLYKLQAESTAEEASGRAIATAKATAESMKITGSAQESQAELKVNALKIKQKTELELLKSKNEVELKYHKAEIELAISKKKELANVEASKFEKIIGSIGQKTLIDIATAGPDAQLKLLKGLGLQGFMITDGKNPINIYNSAQGIILQPEQNPPAKNE